MELTNENVNKSPNDASATSSSAVAASSLSHHRLLLWRLTIDFNLVRYLNGRHLQTTKQNSNPSIIKQCQFVAYSSAKLQQSTQKIDLISIDNQSR